MTSHQATAAHPLGEAAGSASGFWRSARGDNHGRDSRPGDEWVTADAMTDTDRLRWLCDQSLDIFRNMPDDFGQAREYIDSLMLPND